MILLTINLRDNKQLILSNITIKPLLKSLLGSLNIKLKSKKER